MAHTLDMLAEAYAAEESQTVSTFVHHASDEETMITTEYEDTLIQREDNYTDNLIQQHKTKTLKLLSFDDEDSEHKMAHTSNITAYDIPKKDMLYEQSIDKFDVDLNLIQWLKDNDLTDIKDILIAKKYRLLTFKYLNTDDLAEVINDLRSQLTVSQVLRFKSAVNKLSVINPDNNKQNPFKQKENHSTTQTITIIGGSRVGKSSIKDVISGGTFDAEKFPTIRMTQTPQTFSKQIANTNISVQYQVWDCPGQKALEHIPPLYVTGAMAILIVYDITDNVTYERAKEWMQYVVDKGKGYDKVLVVGNKKDLVNERMVSYEEANNFCMQFGYNYIETSAKSGVNMDTLQKWLDSHTQNKVEKEIEQCENNEYQTERIHLEHSVDNLNPTKQDNQSYCCDF